MTDQCISLERAYAFARVSDAVDRLLTESPYGPARFCRRLYSVNS